MMIEEIRENMKKELDQQKAKVQQAAQQRAMIAQQGEMLEKQQAENKLVLMELGKKFKYVNMPALITVAKPLWPPYSFRRYRGRCSLL